MKQPGVLLVLITFVVGVSFVVASEQFRSGTMQTTTLTGLNETGESWRSRWHRHAEVYVEG